MGWIEASNNQKLIDALNKYCCQYEINTLLRVAHFLAQVTHENGCFSKVIESMNYTEKRFLSLYKGTRKTDVYNVSWYVNSKQQQNKPFMPKYKLEPNGLEDRWNKFEKIAKHLGIRK